MLAGLKKLLGHHSVYVALQKGVGADRLRYRCLDELKLADGDTVIDVGCGPAYYFARLPKVRYVGFDTSPHYIAHATKRWGNDQVEFRNEIFGEQHLGQLPPADAILLLGLLHHLSDDQCQDLLRVSAKALAPGGRVISVDPTFHPGQHPVSRWMSANDRGEFVRKPEGFVALAREAFEDVDGEVVDDATRVPSSHWMMRMRAPVLATRDS
ncbi:MAG TPA: class I SAM-dependent methyltransferase [Pilimelia sp.]|nr:class I SAM-dependent methyltransferase [Pilimelia sp.]